MSFSQKDIVKVSDAVIKTGIYLLAFLMPIFFLPWTFAVLDFNKQALLFLTLPLVFVFLIKIIASGNFVFKASKIHVTVIIFFLVYLLSTFFSLDSYASFWGWPQPVSASLVSVILFGAFYFLVSFDIERKDIFTSFALMAVSVVAVSVFAVFQLFGFHLINYGFAKDNFFNTIGSAGSLALFLAVLLPVFLLSFFVVRKRIFYGLFFLSSVLAFVVLVLLNYKFAWWIILASSVFLIFFCFFTNQRADKKNNFLNKTIALPVFLFAVSLFFVFFTPQIKLLPKTASEISLSHQASLNVSWQGLKEKPLFGSGPGTFSYQFSKYKSESLNRTSFWNVNFPAASSSFLTNLTEIGILGTLAFLLMMAAPIFEGGRYFVLSLKSKRADKNKNQTAENSLVAALTVVLVSLTFSYFLYVSSFSLNFLLFFSAAALASLAVPKNRIYNIKLSSFLKLIFIFISAVVFVLGAGLLVFQYQRYSANINYGEGVKRFNSGSQEEGIEYLKKASQKDPASDLYFRELAISYTKSFQDFTGSSPDVKNLKENRSKTDTLMINALGNVNKAVNANVKNANNWRARGYVCQSLTGHLNNASDCAKSAYEKAFELAPKNPYFPLQLGNVYLRKANDLPEERQQEKGALLAEAKEQFNKALELKNNYSAALIQLSLVHRIAGERQEELAVLLKVIGYSPGDLQARFRVGEIYYQAGEWQKAQEQFELILLKVPDSADVLYYSALIYGKLGQKGKALETFYKVLELNPESFRAEEIIKRINDR